MEKLKEEEALDGYYVIITSEYKETSDRIIEMYRGLWKIEKSSSVVLLIPYLFLNNNSA